MEQHIVEAQGYWNDVFSQETTLAPVQSTWIADLLDRASLRLAGPVLEIGCGRGHDTRYLLQAGCCVTCLDLSGKALQAIAHTFPAVRPVNAGQRRLT